MKRKTGSLVAVGVSIFLLVMAWDFACTMFAADWVQSRRSGE